MYLINQEQLLSCIREWAGAQSSLNPHNSVYRKISTGDWSIEDDGSYSLQLENSNQWKLTVSKVSLNKSGFDALCYIPIVDVVLTLHSDVGSVMLDVYHIHYHN